LQTIALLTLILLCEWLCFNLFLHNVFLLSSAFPIKCKIDTLNYNLRL